MNQYVVSITQPKLVLLSNVRIEEIGRECDSWVLANYISTTSAITAGEDKKWYLVQFVFCVHC